MATAIAIIALSGCSDSPGASRESSGTMRMESVSSIASGVRDGRAWTLEKGRSERAGECLRVVLEGEKSFSACNVEIGGQDAINVGFQTFSSGYTVAFGVVRPDLLEVKVARASGVAIEPTYESPSDASVRVVAIFDSPDDHIVRIDPLFGMLQSTLQEKLAAYYSGE